MPIRKGAMWQLWDSFLFLGVNTYLVTNKSNTINIIIYVVKYNSSKIYGFGLYFITENYLTIKVS